MSRGWARRKGGVLAGQNLRMELKRGVHESSPHNSLHFCRCLEFFIIKIFFKKTPKTQETHCHFLAFALTLSWSPCLSKASSWGRRLRVHENRRSAGPVNQLGAGGGGRGALGIF